MLKQILLHEVAHHFIVTEYPAASKECWLNEGLAGNLEVTQFEDGRSEYPLLNPVLMGIVRHAILVSPESVKLKKLIHLGWSEFHSDEEKELDYALSWSIVYFLLEHHFSPNVPLGERIHQLYQIDRAEVVALEPLWLEFLQEFELTEELVELVNTPPGRSGGLLTSRWAVEQLGSLRFLDESRVVPALLTLLESPGGDLQDSAYLAFTKILTRHPDPADRSPALERGREKIAQRL